MTAGNVGGEGDAQAIFDLRRHLPVTPDPASDFPGCSVPASRHPGFEFAMGQSGPADCSGRAQLAKRHHVVVVLDGLLNLATDGDRVALGAGEAAVLGPGTAVDWSASVESRWIVNTYADGAGSPGMRRVEADMPLETSPASPVELLLSAAPECRRAEIGSAPDGLWACGIWEATAYARVPVVYDYYEMMLLLEGSVALATPAGHETRFGKGDLFVIAPGAELGWRSEVTVKKLWSIYRPAKPNG